MRNLHQLLVLKYNKFGKMHLTSEAYVLCDVTPTMINQNFTRSRLHKETPVAKTPYLNYVISLFILTQILVWHTQTADPNMKQEDKLKKIGRESDPSMEV